MKRIAIIGLGLIGASLGMALRDARPQIEILGIDKDRETIKTAISIGAATEVADELDVGGADVVFIATPIGAIKDVLSGIRGSLTPGTIVTDVSSVKTAVMRWMESSLPQGVAVIGGHPMAGSEKGGIAAADKHLFENAVYVLTPGCGCRPAQIEMLKDLIAETGARVKVMNPEEHDQQVARVSHLPHLTAAALMNAITPWASSLDLAGGGLRDTTRIALSDPEMWVDILSLNRDAVLPELDNMVERLKSYRTCLAQGNTSELKALLSEAKEVRMKVPTARVSLSRSSDIVVIVPDRPGIIGLIGRILGDEGININDIQIMGVRDEDEGTMRLAVPSDKSDQAVKVLRLSGIRAWVRD